MQPFHLYKSDRKLAILVDPDKHDANSLLDLCVVLERLRPDVILIGGSLVYKANIDKSAKLIRSNTNIPLVLFPGHFTQLTDHVDGILLLSLISGRNPDLLIGQHVLAAPRLKRMEAKKISTGYMLIDGGQSTSVSYMSHTQPIPNDKLDIAVCTAQAGELIGMHCIYMDAGSGANHAIPAEMVKSVTKAVEIPVIVGGGIRSMEAIEQMWNAGANMVVIGNALEDEEHPLHKDLTERIRSMR
jgi:putative glycerol-1-phosphate prenyltransferase